MAVDRGRDAVRPVPNLREILLPVAAIFGPNASGKSNILAAPSWLRSAVRDSLRMWDDEIPLEPIAFTEGSPLSEFAGERVRKSQNLEKAYLHGRYGALPDVDRIEMLRALGLVG